MKYSILAVLLAGTVLGVAAMSSDADQRKGGSSQERAQEQTPVKQQDMDRLHDQDQIRKEKRIKLKDEDIYGYKLMSPEELKQYRERLRLMKTEEEKNRLEAQHREEMQRRAQALNVKIEDAD